MTWTSIYRHKPYQASTRIENNLIYVPQINDEGDTLCQLFDHTHPYQNIEVQNRFPEGRPFYTRETVTYFFNQQVHYLKLFKDRPWSSNVIDIDYDNQRIYIKYPGHNCNTNLFGKYNLDELCPDWEQQLSNIVCDMYNTGFINITIHPHSFFIENGIMKHYDFYGVVPLSDPTIDFTYLKSIVMSNNMDRFLKEVTDNRLNLLSIFKQTLDSDADWPIGSLNHLHKELFND